MAAAIPVVGGLFNAKSIGDETAATSSSLESEANIQEQNAVIARQSGAYNASRQQDEANKSFGTTIADYAASGVSQDSGSVLNILRQSHTNAELDRLNILHGADIKVINAQNRARAFRTQASNIRSSTGTRQIAAIFGGAAQGVAQMPVSSGSGSGGEE